jgi:hypothetical protein
MRDVEAVFDEVAARMASAGRAEHGLIFHSRGLKSRGRFFAFLRAGEVIAKLPARRVADLIVAGEGSAFDAGRGRPMKEWVRLRAADRNRLADLLSEGRDYVASQPVAARASS